MNADGQRAENVLDLRRVLESSQRELIHAGRRHSIYRTSHGERSFVVKMTAPRGQAVASMRHEYELLHALDQPGIVKVRGLAQSDEGLALVMEDAGPGNLADRIRSGPLSIADFLTIALQLAEAVARLQERRIVHRDLNPTNVVWDANTQRTTLIDFGIATTLAALTVESASPAQLEGTLAYISPEQTGRTGRAVDSRTDLYSLGATLYELLTGTPPFTADDPIELIHAHLARRPRPPHELSRDVPPMVSKIVCKLLEKEPEQRYQTAEALAGDLREARSQWLESGSIAPFPLASHDVPRELSIPDKLYGRDQELRTLNDAFARVGKSGRELVLVTGAPGIGKSALVSHVGRLVTEHHGFYIAGKFDLLQRSVPFSGLAQAFRALVRQLLTEPAPALSRWRERIQVAVAPNGHLLIEVVPELERIIGPQPPVPQLGPVESKHRFHEVFTRFLRVFAQPEHPLALFLDDLQWVDAASLQLIEQWIGDADTRCLLLLGAYRDNEVGAAHPLALSLAGLREAGSAVHEIHLDPIGKDDIAQLTAETFNEDIAKTRPLAELVMHKTAGNPFFVRRLLHLLHAEGLIRFVPQTRTWQWDANELERAPLTDDVLDLMVQAIQRLPEATRTLLQVGACIGHRFDLGTLAAVSGRARTTATDELWPALEDGLLVPVREAYKAPRRAGPLEDSLVALPAIVQFVHDRVQQAAYSLLTEERRRALHLDIGRRLLSSCGNDRLDERLFDIVDQLDLGEALVADPAECQRLVELNLAAGRKAKASAAYQAGFEYLTVAMRHLPARSSDAQSELRFAVHRELAECAYLTGQLATAEKLIEAALEQAPSKVAKVDLYSLRALAATVAGDFHGALDWGREGLAVFGLEWPRENLAAANEAEATAVMTNLGARRIADLVSEPEVEDEEVRACMRLFSILGPPAYFVGADVLTFVMTRATNLSLLHGPSAYSAYAYVFYGALHNARTSEYEVGYELGMLALALARRFGNRAEESRTLEVFGLVVHPWKAPLRDSLPLVREGFRAGVESGELAYAAFNLDSVLINGLPSGVPLAELLVDADIAIEFATRHQNRTGIEIALPFRQVARALRGATRAPTSLDDGDFEEARFLEEAKGNQTAMGQLWVARLQAAYLVGDYETARRSSQEGAERTGTGILGMVTSAEHVFYTALTLAAECGGTSNGQAAPLSALQALHRKLKAWAEHCPHNFAHKQALVGAEIARLGGASLDAIKLYRAAIDGARRNGFVHEEALAHELRGRFFLGEEEPALAGVHLRAARDAYERWGATVKVRALQEAYPEHFAQDGWPASQEPAVDSRTLDSLALDSLALIRASQAISAETIPERLFERILRIVVELAGAQEGALLLCEAHALTVRARITIADEVSLSLAEVPLDDYRELPRAIIRYVAHGKEALVLADATAQRAFALDPVVRPLRSVMCVPLTKQAKVVGLIYLANDAMAGAFTEERVEVVKVLAAQAVISLENSTLLSERDRSERTARFLARAGAALVESLEYSATLARVAHLAVPTFADWCILDLVREDGTVQRAEVAHAGSNSAELAATIKRFAPTLSGASRQPASRALRDGRPVHVEQLSERALSPMAQTDEHVDAMRALSARSLIAVPLIARGQTLGALTFIVAESQRRYDAADLGVAEELAKRCALAIENASLYEAAQAAIRHRDEFLAIASHELKTPLTALQLQLQTLDRKLPKLIASGPEAGALAQKLALLHRQGERLERLVDEMLDISRVSDGRLRLERERVDLSQLVHDVVGRFEERGDFVRSGSPVSVDARSEVIGSWDRLRLEQVVTNLLSNALKYGQAKPVELRVTVGKSAAILEVSDQGLGIEPQHLDRIFGRFERAVSASHYGGLGLGLYIVHQIIRAMDGDVNVTSTLGRGSTFRVTIPLTATASDSRAGNSRRR